MLFDRDNLTVATSLERSGAVILIEQEILERSQQKRAKPTLLLIRATQRVLFKQMGKETLNEILCVSRRKTAVAKKTVKRRPISLAKPGERLSGGLRRLRLPSTQDDSPMRRLKRSTALLQCSRNCLRGYGLLHNGSALRYKLRDNRVTPPTGALVICGE
jgi:hypothetical protein